MFQVTGKVKQSHLGMRAWAPEAQPVGRASLKRSRSEADLRHWFESHHDAKNHEDIHRIEKISNIIKQFKLSCIKTNF